MAVATEKRVLALDVSEVGHHDVREQLIASLREIGCRYRTYTSFWDHFPAKPHQLPKCLVVVADLAHIARHYRRVQDRHAWVASVRKSQLFFLAFVRTKEDERYADLVDDLVRYSDARISVCRSLRPTDVRASIYDAVSAFDPSALASVRYSSPREGVWVEFGDGLFGSVRWKDLGIDDILDDLILESATVGSRGRTMELSQKDGNLFEIDSQSIRSLLDDQLRKRIQAASDAALAGVGQRIRAARLRSGLTQEAFGAMSGLDQAVISKLERGQHQPRYDTLERLAQCFGVTVPVLLSGELETRHDEPAA